MPHKINHSKRYMDTLVSLVCMKSSWHRALSLASLGGFSVFILHFNSCIPPAFFRLCRATASLVTHPHKPLLCFVHSLDPNLFFFPAFAARSISLQVIHPWSIIHQHHVDLSWREGKHTSVFIESWKMKLHLIRFLQHSFTPTRCLCRAKAGVASWDVFNLKLNKSADPAVDWRALAFKTAANNHKRS